MQQGMQQGELAKAREDVIEALEINFEITAPTEVVNVINQITDLSKLMEMLRKAIKSTALEEFADYVLQQK